MEKEQIDIYDMGLSTENHFIDNPTPWAGNAPITNAKAILSNKLSMIGGQLAIQLINTTGTTVIKDEKRAQLEKETFKVSAALSGYASALPDHNLYNRVYFTKSMLKDLREAELIGISVNLLAEATPILLDLAPFGITAATLNSLNATIQAFQQVMKDPIEAIAKRKTATEKLAELIPDLTLFLKTSLDNLVIALEDSEPAFVSTYHNVRLINNSPTNPWSLTTTCLDSATQQPVSGVEVTVVDKNLVRISGQSGFNTFQNLVEGPHKLKVTHPNYATQLIDFTVVSGETTELVILLVHN
jgi:hypothetical protein